MNTLFGLPMSALAVVLPAALGVVLLLVAILALRNPILVRLSARYVLRQTGRAALIVTGLMLATAIITAALTTGDTMTYTIRSSVITSLGNTDEVISTQEQSKVQVPGESAQVKYMDASLFSPIRERLLTTSEVDGVAPAIWEAVAVQDATTLKTEPRMMLSAIDPAYMSGMGEITNQDGKTVLLSDLAADEVYLNNNAADQLKANVGDQLMAFPGGSGQPLRVKGIVAHDGGGTTDSGMMMTLAAAQQMLGRTGQIKYILVSNNGDAVSGSGYTDSVIAAIKPTLNDQGLLIQPAKQDDLKTADDAGAAFTSFFMIFGTFSIIAGIMLILLIFVMLAAERKPEMGMSRAIGAERRHLVEMFAFEGLIYDLIAAAAGAGIGIAVGSGMVFVMAHAVGTFGITIRENVQPRSIIVAYTLGVVLTFAVVTFSAWRVSVLNIVSAIRNLPESAFGGAGRKSLLAGLALIVVGFAIAASGLSSKQATPFFLGSSLLIIAIMPLARWARLPDRLAYTVPGLILVTWWLLPPAVHHLFLPKLATDASIWITSGVMVVAGTTWVVMYNSDRVAAAVMKLMRRSAKLAPVLKIAITYPLTNRFRTGMTLAMFTLVVFTLVVGATTTNAFTQAWNDVNSYGGGYDIRATTVRVNPLSDPAAISQSSAFAPGDFEVIASQSLANLTARQVTAAEQTFNTYPVRGLDTTFLDTNTYGFGVLADGYTSAAQIWQALKADPHLAVVDSLPAPRRSNFGFTANAPDFKLEGFYLEDGKFAPIPVELKDPASGKVVPVTIIGVLKDSFPSFLMGISVSQQLVRQEFPEQAQLTTYFLKVRPGTDVKQTADRLESTFLSNGMKADVLKDELAKAVGANRTFVYIIQGFLGLGLIIGIAALAVISARSVIERRHEIGVMRSIGFERPMVQLSFLLESSMVALVGILLGTALGLVVAWNLIRESASQPSWDNISFAVPWLNLAIVYAVVYGTALVATFFPARQASRVYPAEALRYE